jgi:multiple sugar transport system permease protein
MKPRSRTRSLVIHAGLIAALLLMLYPLIWMVTASFKTGYELTHSTDLLPHDPSLDNFIEGWTALHQPFGLFFINSLILCSLAVLGNVLSCTLAAFAFARLKFPLHRVLFAVMLLTIMLPVQATIVPQFIVFAKLGWVGSILPIIVPKFLAVDAFFVFLLVQFIRSIPTTLDDAAKIDGAGPFRIFASIILPLLTPALGATAIFTFIFTWNDFFAQLLYVGTSVGSYTVPVALRAFIDATSLGSWPQTLAMSTLSLIPVLLFFMFFQRLLVEGISTTGLRG